MKKYYNLGGVVASIERTSSDYFKTVVVEDSLEGKKLVWEQMHSTEADALKEILSYAEIEEEDFNEVKGEQ